VIQLFYTAPAIDHAFLLEKLHLLLHVALCSSLTVKAARFAGSYHSTRDNTMPDAKADHCPD